MASAPSLSGCKSARSALGTLLQEILAVSDELRGFDAFEGSPYLMEPNFAPLKYYSYDIGDDVNPSKSGQADTNHPDWCRGSERKSTLCAAHETHSIFTVVIFFFARASRKIGNPHPAVKII